MTDALKRLLVDAKSPEEVYDALQAQVDPGAHHERELTELYDRLERDPEVGRP